VNAGKEAATQPLIQQLQKMNVVAPKAG